MGDARSIIAWVGGARSPLCIPSRYLLHTPGNYSTLRGDSLRSCDRLVDIRDGDNINRIPQSPFVGHMIGKEFVLRVIREMRDQTV